MALSALASRQVKLEDCGRQRLGGGCISEAWVLSSPHFGQLVYKKNQHTPQNFFLAESQGLEALATAAPADLQVPPVHALLPDGILLGYLRTASSSPSILRRFGRALARLHGQNAGNDAIHSYGFDHDNYLGLTPQPNTPYESWVKFFAECRLGYQLNLARKKGHGDPILVRAVEGVITRLGEIIPDKPIPSLLHGDLWGGNYMIIDKNGHSQAAIIDPAVYRGHYEADLAMTELFGGFGKTFFQGYEDVTPLDREYQRRKEVYNLYHLLNHLNLFGEAYLSAIMASLRNIGV